MGKKFGSGIRIRDEQPGSYFRELRNNFLGLNKHPRSATVLANDRSLPELQVAFLRDEAGEVVEHPRLRGGPRHIDEVLGHVVMSKTKGETFRYRFENETKTFWNRSRICLVENRLF
jgi:hypothetical protein